MTPDRFDQVIAAFNSILEHKVEEQPDMLDAIKQQDPDLCREVEKLLQQSTATWDLGQKQFETAEQSTEDMNALLQERYRLDRELGRGGFGIAYLAYDERLHRKPVVVKFLTRPTQGDEWFQKKFEDEIKALARIDHPGVVGILDAGKTHTGTPFLVMQYAEGVTLRSLICPTGMDLIRVAQIIRQIGQALAAAHACGVLHRDLKPENIMVQQTPNGEVVRLIDFGIATVRTGIWSAGDTTRVVGTRSYMAPEQLRGHPSGASDIFAMGVIAWEMLFGETPFINEPIKAPDAANVKLCEPIAIVRKALSPEPSDRYQNAGTFGAELGEALLAAARVSSMFAADQLPSIQQRMLDVATAKQIPIHKPAEVVTLIRRTDSGGLITILETDNEYSVSKDDVRSKSFRLEFPIDHRGRCEPLELGLRLECPDFEPREAFKTISVPPDRDSEVCSFLVTPRHLGELRMNLDLVRREAVVASRALKMEVLPSDREIRDTSKVLISIPLSIVVGDVSHFFDGKVELPTIPPPTALANEIVGMFKSPAVPPPVPTPVAPTQAPRPIQLQGKPEAVTRKLDKVRTLGKGDLDEAMAALPAIPSSKAGEFTRMFHFPEAPATPNLTKVPIAPDRANLPRIFGIAGILMVAVSLPLSIVWMRAVAPSKTAAGPNFGPRSTTPPTDAQVLEQIERQRLYEERLKQGRAKKQEVIAAVPQAQKRDQARTASEPPKIIAMTQPAPAIRSRPAEPVAEPSPSVARVIPPRARELFYASPPDSSVVKPQASAAVTPAPAKRTPAQRPLSSEGPAQSAPTQAVVDNPAALVPLGIRYRVLKRNAATIYQEIDADTTFHAGDRIRLEAQANSTGYLYVLAQGSSGNWQVLFPSREVSNGSNQVHRGEIHLVPGGNQGQFVFDEQAGTEKLFFVLSRQPEQSLDKLIYSMGGQTATADPTVVKPAAAEPSRVLMPEATIGDDVISRIRGQVTTRDLIFEKVENEKVVAANDRPAGGDMKLETAVYVVSRNSAPDARLVLDLKLKHE